MPGARAAGAFVERLQRGRLGRIAGDVIAPSPRVVATAQIEEMTGVLGSVLRGLR